MSGGFSRRDALKGLGAAGAALVLRVDTDAQGQPLRVGGQAVQVRVMSLSDVTVRVSVIPAGGEARLNVDRALTNFNESALENGGVTVQIAHDPVSVRIASKVQPTVSQTLTVTDQGVLEFDLGERPVLGFGEGGAQFDRLGSVDAMRNGQGGYQLRTHGGRVPIQWLIATGGFGLFIHQPMGAFDLKGPRGRLIAVGRAAAARRVRRHVAGSADHHA